MKHCLSVILIFLIHQGVAQTNEVRKANFNISKGIAINGYDPVSYFDGKPVMGKSEFQWEFNGVVYQFASAANLARFRSSPDKFEPAYGGWCAFAMGDYGEKVKIDPLTYKITSGKLYLFYNFWGNNTLQEWNKNEEQLQRAGDKNWAKILQ
ncbi:MAG TPA: YHS domain-containing (seleno)protein [Cyclobacteriaceae bacterium]|nr:YHS domain-containing (seleno)protein [Cyclobacteriaceae bacterium]HRJ80576.1 YHS domain-containing (seleno)protein [Cyclobacteriaceae bacterium]